MLRLFASFRQSQWKTFVSRMSMKPRIKEKQPSGEKRKTGPTTQQEKALANERLARQQWEKDIAERVAARTLPQVPYSTSGMYYAPWFAPRTYSLEDALAAHREFVAADMLDITDARLFIEATLSMATSKKSKFVPTFSRIILLPHALDFVPRPRLLVLCKTDEEAQRAKAAGAAEAGGKNVLQQFSARQLSLDDFTRVICTTDMVKEVSKMRVLFRDKLPAKATETLCDTGGDPGALESLTRYHLLGVKVDTISIPGVAEEASIRLPLGYLSWSAEQLRANLQAYCQQLRETVSKRAREGGAHFFARMFLMCPPSDERFLIEPPPLSSAPIVSHTGVPAQPAAEKGSERQPAATTDTEQAKTLA